MEQQRHFFFAVALPDGIKKIMKAHCEVLKEELPFRRWVFHEDLHITLAFLGAASPKRLARAIRNVEQAIGDFKAVHLQITRLGIFGKKESPRVLWADMESTEELQSLRTAVYNACEEAGFKLETRPFRPHITIARKWDGENSFLETLLDKWAEIQPDPIRFEVEQIALYETHLDELPKYKAVKIFS